MTNKGICLGYFNLGKPLQMGIQYQQRWLFCLICLSIYLSIYLSNLINLYNMI